MVQLVGRYDLVPNSLCVEFDPITGGCDFIYVEVADDELVLIIHSHLQLRGQRLLLPDPSLSRVLLTHRNLKSVISLTTRLVVVK